MVNDTGTVNKTGAVNGTRTVIGTETGMGTGMETVRNGNGLGIEREQNGRERNGYATGTKDYSDVLREKFVSPCVVNK